MKDQLPKRHGCAKTVLESGLIYRTEGKPTLTDAQYAGLEAGVATGKSLMLVAPTSSGKTEVGLIGIACWLTGSNASARRAVYLVSHRALARQKFNQLQLKPALEVFRIL
ncbi:MAG: DEAD/DEAH box helicase [Alphaproteobacteria bacterium]|nr:DEAD/DEAH box helicase [Alphaproteobacteria bacterium]